MLLAQLLMSKGQLFFCLFGGVSTSNAERLALILGWVGYVLEVMMSSLAYQETHGASVVGM